MRPYDAIMIVTITSLVLACVTVSTRLLVRKTCLAVGLRKDDLAIVVALGFYVAFCAAIFTLIAVEKRNPVLTPSVADNVQLILAVAGTIFMFASVSFKCSLTLFFLPFLVNRTQRCIIISVTTFYSILSFLAIFLCLLPCGNPIYIATMRIEGKCMDTNWWTGLLYTHGALSASSDWIYALLPIHALVRSSLPRATKMSASFILLFAVCGSLCAVLRTIYTNNLTLTADFFDPRHEPTYYKQTTLEIDCAVLELGIGVTAASLACLRPLLQRLDIPVLLKLVSRAGCDNGPKSNVIGADIFASPRPLTMEAQVQMKEFHLKRDLGKEDTHLKLLEDAWTAQMWYNADSKTTGVIPSPKSSIGEEPDQQSQA